MALGQRNTYSGANGLTLLLTFMAVAAWADSVSTLIGAAALLFIFWLPHMAAESAWQAIRVRAYFADSRRLAPLTQVLLAAADVAAFAGTALLLAATYGDGVHGRRAWWQYSPW